MNYEGALGLVRLLIDREIPTEDAIDNPAVPQEFRSQIREQLTRERTIVLRPARMLVATRGQDEWLRQIDRSAWHYWPTLREYLLGYKSWPTAAVRSLDETTDRILGQLSSPNAAEFDTRGLVLGFVQSGKTASYTTLIAKAADVGYRLIVVLAGIDNGLRRQTNLRLKKELVGYPDERPGSVRLPPIGHQWHEFTREEFDGDFRPGFANHGALQGSQPVLLVVKKNGTVLRRLLSWLDAAPENIRRTIPLIVIDDEADQASVDTRGSYQTEDEPPLPEDYEEPSIINGLIRDLLRKFQKCAYVAYTATPFANILIPHDTFDPRRTNDLYPRDFIVDLPRPTGYFGPEELFGRVDEAGQVVGGLDVIREVQNSDLDLLANGTLPPSFDDALLAFVLAGAGRALRGQSSQPATMLVHASSRILDQSRLATEIGRRFAELRDEWRYDRATRIEGVLENLWESDFSRITRSQDISRVAPFRAVHPHIGPFFESVQIREINSATGAVFDYDREPSLKAIAVGGNRLSRGLTLEGLQVSYFVRRTVMYDTLMQMGRWFGFRNGYEDLTRIYTTAELRGWFSDLAHVEYQLREDIHVYERLGLTPLQLGTRIQTHPSMLVTSNLKQRFASRIEVQQSYATQVVQTFKFPFRQPDQLAVLAERCFVATRALIRHLGASSAWEDGGPLWYGIPAQQILAFLREFQVDEQGRRFSLPLVREYIERQNDQGELTQWTVAVKGRNRRDSDLGEVDWGADRSIFQISRTRLRSDPDSIGVLTEPGHELEGLSPTLRERARELATEQEIGVNPASRQVRPATDGLILLYPISRNSGQSRSAESNRQPLFEDPDSPLARDLIGLAVSFPASDNPQPASGFLVGTAGWRPVE